MDDKELYRAIAREIAANKMDPARWTQAFAESEGDREKAKAIYIRLRHADLAPAQAKAPAGAAPTDPLAALRLELAEALARSGRGSLYRTLGVAATSTDRDIAAAIKRLQGAAATPDAEVRYAIETLGNPAAREHYDRSLLKGLGRSQGSEPGDDLEMIDDAAHTSVFMQWWATRKVSILVGVVAVALLGFVALPYYQTETARDLIDTQTSLEQERQAQQAKWKEAQHERLRQADERRNAQQSTYQQRQAQYEQERLLRQVEEDQRRIQYAQQAQARQAEQEARSARYEREQRQRQAQVEARLADQRAAQEAAYWSCFNDAMDRGDSAYAHQRCGRLKY